MIWMVTWLSQRGTKCHQAGPMFIGVSCVLVFVSFAEGLALCLCVCGSMCELLCVSCVHLHVCTQVCV